MGICPASDALSYSLCCETNHYPISIFKSFYVTASHIQEKPHANYPHTAPHISTRKEIHPAFAVLPLTLPRLHMQDSTKPPLGCTTDIVPPRQPRLDERNRKPKRLVETAAGSLATTRGAIAAHISPPWFLWLLSHGRYWCLQTHLNQVWLLVPSPFVLQFTLDHVKCWFPSKDNLTEDTDNSEKKKDC